MPSEIQAVLFEKNKYSKLMANYWLFKHKLKKIKPFHVTRKFYRARIKNPSKYERMRIKRTSKGINFIIGFY